MSDLSIILKRISDEGKIEYVLEQLGCEYIKSEQNGELITAQLPDRFESNNKRNVQVKYNDYCNARIWSKGLYGNLYDLINYIKYDERKETTKRNINDIKNWLLNILGWSYNQVKTYEDKIDPISWLRKIRQERNNNKDLESEPLDESVLDRYIKMPFHDWYMEGITVKTQIFFQIGFDLDEERVVIPIRNEKGELVNVKGRTLIPNYKELDIVKYKYLFHIKVKDFLFNLNNASDAISNQQEVIIFEGEKSVMKMWQYGYKNCIALGGSNISPYQIKKIKQLGMDKKIIFAFDKDKTSSEIMEEIKRFEVLHNRKIYVIFDRLNYLNNEDAPIDQGLDTWLHLYKNFIYKVNNS